MFLYNILYVELQNRNIFIAKQQRKKSPYKSPRGRMYIFHFSDSKEKTKSYIQGPSNYTDAFMLNFSPIYSYFKFSSLQ